MILSQRIDLPGPSIEPRYPVHPVSVTRFPSFRTQPLENLSIDSVTKGFLSNPAPGENLESGNLVMETGCINSFMMVHVCDSISRMIILW